MKWEKETAILELAKHTKLPGVVERFSCVLDKKTLLKASVIKFDVGGYQLQLAVGPIDDKLPNPKFRSVTANEIHHAVCDLIREGSVMSLPLVARPGGAQWNRKFPLVYSLNSVGKVTLEPVIGKN